MKNINIWELSAMLLKAIEDEDYLRCSKIKKEIDNRIKSASEDDLFLIKEVKKSKQYLKMNNVFQKI